MRKFPLYLLLTIFVCSCSTRKEIVYFQGAEELEGMENPLDYEPVIEQNDVLRINVSSMNEEVVAPFQMNTGGQQGGGGGGGQNLSLTGYLVDTDGNINFPVLGEVDVANKTRSEVQDLIQDQVRDYVTDAVVDVRIVNFRVTVLGETGAGRVEVTDGRITVPEALAMSGDITYDGKRDNILVIREADGIKSVGRVDMTQADIFTNPYYYLKQNDIVYVEPTYRRVKSAGIITSYTGIFSLITSAISLYFIFTR